MLNSIFLAILAITAQAEPITFSNNAGPVMPNLPQVPTNAPQPPAFSADLQRKIEESFKLNKERMKAMQPELDSPVKADLPNPEQVPAPPTGAGAAPVFSQEVQASLDFSFGSVVMPTSNLSSFSLVQPASVGEMVIEAYRQELIGGPTAEAAAKAPLVTVLTKEEQEAIRSPLINLAKDSVDPHSAVGKALLGQIASEKAQFEEQSLFEIVHARYSAREHELVKARVVAGR